MLAAIKRMPRALAISILLHLLILAIVLISFNWTHEAESTPAASGEPEPIQATMVDAATIEAEMNKLKAAEEARERAERQRLTEIERKQMDVQRKAEEAERRQQEVQRQAAEAERRQLEAQRKAAEAEAKAREQAEIALRKQKEAEAQAKALEEAKRKAAEEAKLQEQKRLAEAEAAKKAEAAKAQEDAKRKIEAEAKAKAEAQAKAQEEAKRKAELEAKAKAEAEAALKAKAQEEAAARQKAEAEARRKAELAAQLAAEENAAANAANARRLAGLKDQYIAAIKAKVQRNWLKPPSAMPGMSCKVRVIQMPGGMVMDVRVEQCTGDELFKRSVINAVEKSSPLPPPPDPAVFDRELDFTFTPE